MAIVNMLTLFILTLLAVSNMNLINATITCNTTEDCNISCEGNGKCISETIQCPTDHKCTITCTGTHSCVGMTLNASLSSELTINGCVDSSTCSLSKIYCPIYNSTKKCSISGNNNIRDHINFYAINGWADMNVNYTGDYSVDSSIMYCLSDYSIYCSLASDSFQCNPNENTACNNGITLSPTHTTTTPTSYPTNLPTTNQPTANPSPTIAPIASVTDANVNGSYETALGLGSIFGFDVAWIIIIVLSTAICAVACFICCYCLQHRNHEKHLAETINGNDKQSSNNKTIELNHVDYPSTLPADANTNPLGNNPTLSAMSAVAVYEKGTFDKTNVPMYYGTHVNQQQQQQHQSVAVNRFYPQSSADSNNSTQNSSAKSTQSQSYNNHAGHNIFQNYGPQSYPTHNNYYLAQQNNTYMNTQPPAANMNYNNQNRQPNYNQPPSQSAPQLQQHNRTYNTNQPMQAYSQQYMAHTNTQPQSFPTQQNQYLHANNTIQIIKPGLLKPMESAVSEATTGTTATTTSRASTATSRVSTTYDASVADYSDESEDSSEEHKDDNDNNEPPIPNTNVNNNHLAAPMQMERPHFRITVTNESNMPALPSANPQLNDMNTGSSYASSYASSYTSASAYTDSSYPDSSNRDSQMTESIMESIDATDADVIVDVAYDRKEDDNDKKVVKPTLDDIIVNADVINVNDEDIDEDMLEDMNEMLEFQDINCGNDTPASTTTMVTMVLNDVTSQGSTNVSPQTDVTTASSSGGMDKFPKTRGNLVVLNENESCDI